MIDNKELIAFAAGLYEGEGTVGAYIENPTPNWDKRRLRSYLRQKQCRIQLKISMTDLEPIQEFHEIVEVGSLRGPFTRGRLKPYYVYSTRSFSDIEEIMVHFWQYLSPRRREQYKSAVFKFLNFRSTKL